MVITEVAITDRMSWTSGPLAKLAIAEAISIAQVTIARYHASR